MLDKQITLDGWDNKEIIVNANQGEVDSRFLQITLLNGNIPCDLTNATIYLYCKKADGTEILYSSDDVESYITITNAIQGKIGIGITEQMSLLVGQQNYQIWVETAESPKAIFIGLVIDVRANAKGTAVESSNEFKTLDNAIAKVNSWDSSFNAKYNEVSTQFQTKYDGLETEYAQDITEVKGLVLNGDESLQAKYNKIESGTTLTNSGTIKGKPIADIPESTSKLTPILNPITNKIEWEVADMAKIGDIKTFVNAPTENWLLADGSEHYIADYQDFWDNCGISNGGSVTPSFEPAVSQGVISEIEFGVPDHNACSVRKISPTTTGIFSVYDYWLKEAGGNFIHHTYSSNVNYKTYDSQSLNCLATNENGTIVIKGYNGSYYGYFISTDNGQTFSFRSPPHSNLEGHSICFFYVNGFFYCLEHVTSPAGYNYLYRSADGLSWTEVHSYILDSYQSIYSIVANGNSLLAMGMNGRTYTSEDNGLSWTGPKSGTYFRNGDITAYPSYLFSYNNMIIAHANSNYDLFSNDFGLSWQKMDSDCFETGIGTYYIQSYDVWVNFGYMAQTITIGIRKPQDTHYNFISSPTSMNGYVLRGVAKESDSKFRIFVEYIKSTDPNVYSIEELLWDISNPTKFITPDYCSDFSSTYIKVKDGE